MAFAAKATRLADAVRQTLESNAPAPVVDELLREKIRRAQNDQTVAWENRRYVVFHKDSREFFKKSNATGFDTDKWHIDWSEVYNAAAKLGWKELVDSGLLMTLTCAFGGAIKIVRVE